MIVYRRIFTYVQVVLVQYRLQCVSHWGRFLGRWGRSREHWEQSGLY